MSNNTAGQEFKSISKVDFYGAIKEYEKEDSMFVPPLLKNYMLGFFEWLLKKQSPTTPAASEEAVHKILMKHFSGSNSMEECRTALFEIMATVSASSVPAEGEGKLMELFTSFEKAYHDLGRRRIYHPRKLRSELLDAVNRNQTAKAFEIVSTFLDWLPTAFASLQSPASGSAPTVAHQCTYPKCNCECIENNVFCKYGMKALDAAADVQEVIFSVRHWEMAKRRIGNLTYKGVIGADQIADIIGQLEDQIDYNYETGKSSVKALYDSLTDEEKKEFDGSKIVQSPSPVSVPEKKEDKGLNIDHLNHVSGKDYGPVYRMHEAIRQISHLYSGTLAEQLHQLFCDVLDALQPSTAPSIAQPDKNENDGR